VNRRALLAAASLCLLSAGAAAQHTRIWTIGVARMAPDGTIILDLDAPPGSTTGRGPFVYPPDDGDYAMILRHLGGLRPGEAKAVPPFS
jgi:ribonuclease PH